MNESLNSVIIEDVSHMFGQSSEENTPHQNKEKLLILFPHFFPYIQPPRSSKLNPVDLCVCACGGT